MKLKNVLITVADTERSAAFYREVFGLGKIADFGGNVMLTEGLVLQERGLWERAIGRCVTEGSGAAALYFEEPDLAGFRRRLKAFWPEVVFLEGEKTGTGDRECLRFFDPDGHLIEVGRPWRSA